MSRFWLAPVIIAYCAMKLWAWFFAIFMDFPVWLAWTQRAAATPLNKIYGGDWVTRPGDWAHRALNPDRFPTDIYLLELWARILGAFPEVEPGAVLMTAMQVTIWVFELLCVVVLFSLFKKLGVKRSFPWAVSFLVLPFFALIANQQFTLEFVALFFILLGFRLLLEQRVIFDVLGGISFVLAAFERPQFGLLMAGVLAVVWSRHFSWWRPLALFGPASLFAAIFAHSVGLGLWWQGTTGSLIDLVRFNTNFYENFIVNGATAWAFWPMANVTPFADKQLLGIPVESLSLLLIGLVVIAAVLTAARSTRNFEYRLWWALALVSHGIFFFSLKMIDRYNFVAIVMLYLLLVLYSSERKLWSLFLVVMTSSFLNGFALYALWDLQESLGLVPWVELTAFVYMLIAFGNLFAFYLYFKAIAPESTSSKGLAQGNPDITHGIHRG